MEDVLVPLGVLLVMGVIVAALLRIAPRHDREMANAFEEFSIRHGLRYMAEDDGRVRDFVRDFDSIGYFESPSLGRVSAADVVSGTLDGVRILLFRHAASESEDEPGAWFVAGVEAREPVASRGSVQFCRQGADSDTRYLRDPVLKREEIGLFDVVVRAADASSAGELLDQQLLRQLAERAEELSLHPEIQVRDRRVVVYPANPGTARNEVQTLDRLLALARRTAGIGR